MLIRVLASLCATASVAFGQWAPQQSNTNAEFRGLVAVSPTVAWASGTRGRYVRTTDGGVTWTVGSVAGADSLDFRDMHAASTTSAWLMSAGPAEKNQAQIFHTTDGTSWTRQFQTMQKGVFLDAISFWDDKHGIAMGDPVGGHVFVLTTDDGGATWTVVPSDKFPPVLDKEGAFAASGTCMTIQGNSNVWIATGGATSARVFRSTDRGRTWQVADTPVHAGNAASGIFSVAFTDARHGVAVGGDYSKPRVPFENVALTDDGGATWHLAPGPLPVGYMSAVAYLPGTNGRTLVAVGLGGTARSDDGGNRWTMIDSVPYNSIAFASKDVGWAAGPRGRIAKWSPAGSAAKP